MAVASFSPEGRMIAKLLKLGCSEFAFQKIVQGICGKNRIIEAFKDPAKNFDNELAERLMEKILQMEELQAAVAPVPVDWSRADKVATALTIRLASKIADEMGISQFQVPADEATKAVQASASASQNE